ncbi:hypothetical protein P872_19895 [Rhodonellum psychrophilum GCM71 = DSM 17998]|uniref:Uncharacterized protein n=1 Tax=Rhodonellum psychrophilum GCM71 = DSM 17998 TaxID=1123057 RepID=U5BM98_9BACT|nr:hypothetical protein P872_19895 [Rhodonellum psychrophilum GCM71 = DSM 17998]
MGACFLFDNVDQPIKKGNAAFFGFFPTIKQRIVQGWI